MLMIVRAAALAALLPFFPIVADASDVPHVVAAENFYGEVAREIGGDAISVTTILSKPDADPHLFEAAPSTARAVGEADIVVYNGAGYDHWMEKLLSVSDRPDRRAIVAAKLTAAEGGDNPHLWYDPATFPAIAKALATELQRRDASHAATYASNLAAFEDAFAKVDVRIRKIRASYSGTPVTATEPVFGHMASALGFKMLNGDFQTAMMNETEPSPRQVAAFEKSLRDGEARILFYNDQVRDGTTGRLLSLAKASGVAVIGVGETMPEGATIESWLGGELDAIARALEPTN